MKVLHCKTTRTQSSQFTFFIFAYLTNLCIPDFVTKDAEHSQVARRFRNHKVQVPQLFHDTSALKTPHLGDASTATDGQEPMPPSRYASLLYRGTFRRASGGLTAMVWSISKYLSLEYTLGQKKGKACGMYSAQEDWSSLCLLLLFDGCKRREKVCIISIKAVDHSK